MTIFEEKKTLYKYMKNRQTILIWFLLLFISNCTCLGNTTTNNIYPSMHNNIKTAKINKNMTREQKKEALAKYLQDIGCCPESLTYGILEYIRWSKVENDLPIYFYQALDINCNPEDNGWENFDIYISQYAHDEYEMKKYINIVNILQTNKKNCSLWLINRNFREYSELYDQIYQNPKIKNKEKAFINEVKNINRQEDWKETKKYIYYVTMPIWIVPAIIFNH